MIIIKVEKENGMWEYHDFDEVRQAAIYLIKRPHLKLRLAAAVSPTVKKELEKSKHQLEQCKEQEES